jgi:RimJ/RimL family protein N-acetyltransferase
MAVMSVPAIRFRPLAESDLPDLVEWFAEPEIAKWWNQPAEIDSVRAKYLPRIEQREPTQMWTRHQRRCGSRYSWVGDDDELAAWSVGCLADLVDRESAHVE